MCHLSHVTCRRYLIGQPVSRKARKLHVLFTARSVSKLSKLYLNNNKMTKKRKTYQERKGVVNWHSYWLYFRQEKLSMILTQNWKSRKYSPPSPFYAFMMIYNTMSTMRNRSSSLLNVAPKKYANVEDLFFTGTWALENLPVSCITGHFDGFSTFRRRAWRARCTRESHGMVTRDETEREALLSSWVKKNLERA